MNFALPAILCSLVCLATIQAKEPEAETTSKDSSGFTVTAECQIVVLPQKEALLLLPQLADDTKCEAGYERLQELIQGGKAQLIGHLVLKTQNGKAATSEAVEELRYPTEFSPPDLPDPNQFPKEIAVELLKNLPVIGITPSSFETRNVGPSVEITPISLSADGRSVEIEVSARDVRFLHWRRWDAVSLPSGEKLGIDQPQFHSIKNSGTLRLQNGQRILFGAHKIPADQGSMEFFLLRVSASKF